MWFDEIMADDKARCWNTKDGFEMLNTVMCLRHNGGAIAENLNRPQPSTTEKMIQNLFDDVLKHFDSKLIESRSMKDLTAMSVKVRGGRRVDFENCYHYNLKWLKTLRRAFPDGRWYVIPSKGWRSPLYVIDDEKGMACLLPMRVIE